MSYPMDSLTKGGGLRYKDGIAGEVVTTYQVVYAAGDGRWYLADADVASSAPLVGLTVDPAIIGQKSRILIKGIIQNLSWAWTPGQEIYLSQTAGGMTQTAPTLPARTQVVGAAITANVIWFEVEGAGLGGGATGCALLEGATAYVGFDSCKEPYTNYWLCDGAADDVEINAAITYLGSSGGRLLLERGIYDITATLTVTLSANYSLIIEGEGKNTILVGSIATMFDVSNGAYIQGDNYPRLSLKHLKFQQSTSAGTDIGLDLRYSTVNLEDVAVENTGARQGTGIIVGPKQSPGYCNWSGVEVLDYGTCYDISVDHLSASGLQAIRPNTYGYYIHDSGWNVFVNLFVLNYVGTASTAFKFHQVDGATPIVGVYIETQSTGYAFDYTTGINRYVSIYGVEFQPAPTNLMNSVANWWMVDITQWDVTVMSGKSTGTGGQQTIAHGLHTTPNYVALWNIENGANPYQSAAADATNIYVTAVINLDWGWEAKRTAGAP